MCDFVGIINPKFTDMNQWINFVLANADSDKWSFTKNNNNAIPQVSNRIAVISTDSITINVTDKYGAMHSKKLPKDCVYAIVEVVSSCEKHVQNLNLILSDDDHRSARNKNNYHVGIRIVENLWGNTQRGKQYYRHIMNGRKRSDLDGPRQSTFKRL